MKLLTTLLLSTSLVAAAGSVAQADPITAGGQGWCNPDQCNGTVTSLNNTFAGSHLEVEFRNWFSFRIPDEGNIVAATINIWNDEDNFTDVGGATFELRNASTLSFGGLAGLTTLGSVSVDAANMGRSRFIPIALNNAALSLLNAAQGGTFLFGGVVTPFSPTSEIQIFGYTQGPPAAFLTLTSDPAPIPEPSTFLLLATGGAAIMLKRRRREQAASA